MEFDMDKIRVVTLVEVLLDEVNVLRDMVDDLQSDLDRKDQLLAEKAEIIKMLGKTRKGRPKVTSVTPKKNRKPGRPKGSKNKK